MLSVSSLVLLSLLSLVLLFGNILALLFWNEGGSDHLNSVALLLILIIALLFLPYTFFLYILFLCLFLLYIFFMSLPLDALHCCSKYLFFLTPSNSLSRFMSSSRSILLADCLSLTAFCSSVLAILCTILLVLLSHYFWLPSIGCISTLSLLIWTRTWWLLSFQSGALSKLKTCQKNHDNNIAMCDIIAETISLLLALIINPRSILSLSCLKLPFKLNRYLSCYLCLFIYLWL